MNVDWSIVGSGFAGAIIGAAAALLGVFVSHVLSMRAERRAEELRRFRYLQALYEEIYVFWHAYSDAVGSALSTLDDGGILDKYFTQPENVFAVFDGTVNQLGSLKEVDLRSLVVTTYSQAKRIVNQMALHNETLRKWENAYWDHREASSELMEIKCEKLEGRKRALMASTRALVEMHKDLKLNAERLLREMQKGGVLDSVRNE